MEDVLEIKKQKDEFYKLQAIREQHQENLEFFSDESRVMDRSNREVVAILDALANMLVITKERLKPFLDDGFVHEDR
jgi:hypothetical protein